MCKSRGFVQYYMEELRGRSTPPELRMVVGREAEAGSQIRLNVTAFELESHSSCNYDYLEIR